MKPRTDGLLTKHMVMIVTNTSEPRGIEKETYLIIQNGVLSSELLLLGNNSK